MFKEIVENIALAEKRAEEIETEALEKVREIRRGAGEAAGQILADTEKEIKAAVKALSVKAAKKAEAKAAETVEGGDEAHVKILKAAEKKLSKAVDKIVSEFYDLIGNEN